MAASQVSGPIVNRIGLLTQSPHQRSALRRPREGLADFEDWTDYLENWLRPNLLEDLHTVFNGTVQCWNQKRSKNPMQGDGRGDFILATALFTIFDHLGSFLAEPGKAIVHSENIARIASRLGTTRELPAVVANLGRNALVHGAWPQTRVDMEKGKPSHWCFGVSIMAWPDTLKNRHLESRIVPQTGRGDGGPGLQALKLTLNIHSLHQELRSLLLSTEFTVAPEHFRRVKQYQQNCGDPRGDAKSDADQLLGYYHIETRKGKWTRVYDAELCTSARMETEIRNIRRAAQELGAWPTVGKLVLWPSGQ